MIELTGLWYPEYSSAQTAAILELDRHSYRLLVDDLVLKGQQARLNFSQRIGNIPRRITLADGSVFACNDNDAIDRWLKQTKHDDSRYHLLHRLESQWRWVILSIIVVIVFSGAFIWKGIPWISTEIALSMPVGVYQKIGSGTLAGLDKWLLDESELPGEVRERIKRRFERILSRIGQDEYRFQLHFRSMKNLANAFALPSGDIVITDGLLALADNDEEIDAVLMHEIAHVVQRHSLQQIIQSSALTVIVTLILGDATAISNIVIALPTFLLESSYSRQHETEADEYALEKMVQAGIDPVHFANIMRKFMTIELDHGGKVKTSSTNEDQINSYLSSHPATQERIERALGYAHEFGQYPRALIE